MWKNTYLYIIASRREKWKFNAADIISMLCVVGVVSIERVERDHAAETGDDCNYFSRLLTRSHVPRLISHWRSPSRQVCAYHPVSYLRIPREPVLLAFYPTFDVSSTNSYVHNVSYHWLSHVPRSLSIIRKGIWSIPSERKMELLLFEL